MSIFPLLIILLAVAYRSFSAATLPIKAQDLTTNVGYARTESFITYARAVGNCAEANPTLTGTLDDGWLQAQGCLPAAWIRPPGADWTNEIETLTIPGSNPLSVLRVWGTTPPGTAQGLGNYLAHMNAVSDEAGYAPPPPRVPGLPPPSGQWFDSQDFGINQYGSWWSPTHQWICTGCIPNYIPQGAILMMFDY